MTLADGLEEKDRREEIYNTQDKCVSIGFYSPQRPGWGLWVNDYNVAHASWERRGTGIMACSPEISARLNLTAKPTQEELDWEDFELFEIDWTDF